MIHADNEMSPSQKLQWIHDNRKTHRRWIGLDKENEIMHDFIIEQGRNESTGRETRYEPVSFGTEYRELPADCKAAYIMGRCQLMIDRSLKLENEIIDTRTAYEKSAPPTNTQQEYFERYWPLKCDSCGKKTLLTEATARLTKWCLSKTELCPECHQTITQEMEEAFGK